MYKDWKKAVLKPGDSLRRAVKAIDDSLLQVALALDEEGRLKGVITDGDVRRAIVNDMDLDAPAERIMSTRCTTARTEDSEEDILDLMRRTEIRQIPVLDEAGRVVDVKLLMDLVVRQRKENVVVLMAGGLGTRLRPLTQDCPKPLLKVGGRPVLETIIKGFKDFGFRRFFLSVNYMAHMIEEYFGDGHKLGVEIEYLRENSRLGTAGCLGLFPTRPKQTFFVMNGDLLTRINFNELLEFHNAHNAKGTMGIREHEIQVPYGIVEVRNHSIQDIKEKPVKKFYVNAGIYALEPELLDLIEPGQYLDMPDLLKQAMLAGKDISAYVIHEYWLDIGQHHDFERAENEFGSHFKPEDKDRRP